MKWTMAAILGVMVQETKGEDLAPLKEATKWTYVAEGSEFTIKVSGREKVGKVECAVVETTVKDKQEQEHTQKEYFAVTEEGLKSFRVVAGARTVETTPPILRIKFPIKKGDSWEWAGKQGDKEQKAAFTNEGEEEIKTPAGTYKAWKIVVVIDQEGASSTAAYWYAAGVGMIRQDVSMNLRGKLVKLTTELKAFEAGK